MPEDEKECVSMYNIWQHVLLAANFMYRSIVWWRIPM